MMCRTNKSHQNYYSVANWTGNYFLKVRAFQAQGDKKKNINTLMEVTL